MSWHRGPGNSPHPETGSSASKSTGLRTVSGFGEDFGSSSSAKTPASKRTHLVCFPHAELPATSAVSGPCTPIARFDQTPNNLRDRFAHLRW